MGERFVRRASDQLPSFDAAISWTRRVFVAEFSRSHDVQVVIEQAGPMQWTGLVSGTCTITE